jgi:enoyl-CoA hydratase/carnithine racemase
MAYEQIETEVQGRVGIIRLNRPERLNAWTAQMNGELGDQVQRWNADPAVGAFVITGNGRAFCAGADMGGFNNRLREQEAPTTEFSARWTTLMRKSKPSVVAFNGFAIGVGLTMALPCDLRVAAEGARLSIRFIRMGLIPELGSTRILSQLVGLGHATDMCLSGRMVEAAEAQQMGLVSAVVAPDQLMATALARAEELANNPTTAIMMIKELLATNPLDPDLDRVMEREGVRDRIARKLPDHAEAVKAFLEKREPHFNA